MKSIILYNQGGYSPELLAFNGETNFAILYYACTIKPYVLARKLDDDVRSDEFEEVACKFCNSILCLHYKTLCSCT